MVRITKAHPLKVVADVFHILGNLWFLWLAAVSLEDRWGRPVFLGFYLLAEIMLRA
jgi:membrane associated rhomboid family serine protease